MPVRTLRVVSSVAVCTTAVIMWWPERYAFGLDLGNLRLQGCAFAACALLWALSLGGRLRTDPYFEFRSSVWQTDIPVIRRNVARVLARLIGLAAVLELGQTLLPHRHGNFGEFFLNALGILAVGVLVYGLLTLALRTPLGRRVAQKFTTID